MSKRKRRCSRARPGSLPKGAYRLPNGNYVTKPVHGETPNGRRISIVAVRRDPVDAQLLAQALLDLAREQARAKKQRESR